MLTKIQIGRLAHSAAVLACASVAGAQQTPTFTPLHASGIYDIGERAGWTMTIPDGVRAPSAGYTYVITKNNFDTVRTGTLDVIAGRAVLAAVFDEPAMLYARVTIADSGRSRTVNLGAAIAPFLLKPSAPRPADFDAFWHAKLAALAKIPVNPVLTPVKTNVPGVELSMVKLASLGSTTQGYLAKPKRDGRFPALVIFQYAGVYPLQPQWSTDPATEGWLVLDVDSHDVLPDRIDGVPKNYNSVGNTNRDSSYFLAMYLRDKRAIDYIASRPDWDGRVIVATGTSMGGQQSLVTASLDSRITAVVVNEPSGSDALGDLHGRRQGYPNWPTQNPSVAATAPYFDVVNFAPHITAPTLIAVGFIDTTAPPVGIIITFDQIAGEKELIPMIDSDHNHITPEKQGEWSRRSKEVLDLLRGGGTWTPTTTPRR
jgi:cephalosporin-C deacetylase-like acetyl esterase